MMNQANIQNVVKASAVLSLALGLFVISADQASYARGWGGQHPRRAEVLGRDRGMAGQMNRDYGHLGGHYNQLQGEDRSIHQQEASDFRANGGYLTRGQQAQFNHEENGLQHQINQDYAQGRPAPSQFAQNHPRRAEVLGRDNRINGTLNSDYGKLGGNYGQLRSEDQSIRSQEQSDARANGGYITPTQKQQLNSEENSLNQQIKQDYQ